MKKLTKPQLELLMLMQQSNSRVHYMHYMGRFNPNAYYFESNSMKKYTKQTEALLKHGLAECYDTSPFSGKHKVRLTEAGKNYK